MKNSKFNFTKFILTILFILSSCSVFDNKSDIEDIKRYIILDVLNEPDKFVEIINKNPLKGKNFIPFKEMPNITFDDFDNRKQINIPFNQLIKESKSVEIFCDKKKWIYSGGGYKHIFLVKCFYKEYEVNIRFSYIYENNVWVFGSMGYTEIPYCF